MNLDTLTTILITVAPAFSAVVTIILGFIKLTRTARANMDKTQEIANDRVNQTAQDINLIKSKISSMESHMTEVMTEIEKKKKVKTK